MRQWLNWVGKHWRTILLVVFGAYVVSALVLYFGLLPYDWVVENDTHSALNIDLLITSSDNASFNWNVCPAMVTPGHSAVAHPFIFNYITCISAYPGEKLLRWQEDWFAVDVTSTISGGHFHLSDLLKEPKKKCSQDTLHMFDM